MNKTVKNLAMVTLVALAITGCGDKKPEPKKEGYNPTFQCKQENVLAPRWTCIPEVEGFYAGVGVAEKSAAGMAHMRRVAMMNGRSDLAQQIQTQVKDKIEGFTRATGNGSDETVDKVTTAVTKQIAKVDLKGSKAIDMWQAPSGALYMLVTIPEESINAEVKKAVKSSFKNDNALWQQFQSKQALEQLDKEFPTE
ncbi:MAG: LPP20 family lipoprotein [Epsilonproteobacteria bacterium]|nr:LPP20 family lipoprotein [Campylobacterota bacterium]